MLYRYTGEEDLVYPYARIGGGTTALTATPGMEPVEFDAPPDDGRWEQTRYPKRSAKKTETEAAKAVEE